MVQVITPDGDAIFQHNNASINTAHVVTNWYEEHEGEYEHIEWPPQSPGLNIIVYL